MASQKILFLDLNSLPDFPKHDHHLWADYIELRCLTNQDWVISQSDLLDLNDEQRNFRQGKDEEDDLAGDNIGADLSSEDLKTSIWLNEIFLHIAYRVAVFKEYYPFTISKDKKVLSRRAKITAKHQLYIFFLLSSNTGYIINEKHRGRFTSNFEILSMKALKSYLPENAEVHLFGSNPLNKGKYTGSLLPRIKLLATDIREKFIGDETEYSPHDTGDNGLDVVGWVPILDNARGFLLILGQCACTAEEWAKKQSSSSAAHWRDTIGFKVPPNNMVFIPFCYRRSTGGWHKHRMIDESIVIDRLRLILLLRKYTSRLLKLPEDLIKQALQQRDRLI